MSNTETKAELLQCTRCRNKHTEAERIDARVKRYGILITESRCPKCNAAPYYKIEK